MNGCSKVHLKPLQASNRAAGPVRNGDVGSVDVRLGMGRHAYFIRYLKQLKKNREEERELMKDVPGWEVGTYYGERLYKTISPDTHIDPFADEFFAHAEPKRAYDIWHYWDTNF
ncbi:hypothetical protein HPB52_015957 [Rhipicephalus sanguineus]|uniref:NADH dehydrogenase [ubiquinone] 1 alpha subcomplex subunit 13 n=1 Tax=Rhipicephalus sanguineus TaxID=34632 RepID=A0A9D4PWY9_RHISA|nr:hypothetical protein HPB52_015957 [Rhipicephalus sanguineus]